VINRACEIGHLKVHFNKKLKIWKKKKKKKGEGIVLSVNSHIPLLSLLCTLNKEKGLLVELKTQYKMSPLQYNNHKHIT
jgi:hypothetical protein